jgi:hypothetical protein
MKPLAKLSRKPRSRRGDNKESDFLKLNYVGTNWTEVVKCCLTVGFCDTDDEQWNLYCRGYIVWNGI